MDQNCVRDLLLYLSEQLAPTPTGKLPKPLKLKHHIDTPALSAYAPEIIYDSAQYVVKKGFADIAALDPKNIPRIAPRQYVFLSLSAKGVDYLRVIKDNTLWSKLKGRLSNVFEETVPNLIALAAQLGASHLLS